MASQVWPPALFLVASMVLQGLSVIATNDTAAGPNPRSGVTAPPRPQYYIHFGLCYPTLQYQQYGNWVMTRSLSQQKSNSSIILYLDTKSARPVSKAFGTVEPPDFPIEHIYFGYFNKSGVRSWSTKLDNTPYKEVPSWYWVKVNGKPVLTVRDLKDSGPAGSTTTAYSMKGTLGRGTIVPSATPYKIEIFKNCGAFNPTISCGKVPDPARVFTSREGYLVFSLWSVHQPLTVNGTYVPNHAWCPVQTVVDIP